MQKDLRHLTILGAMVLGVGYSALAMASYQSQLPQESKITHFYVAGHVGATFNYIRHKETVNTSGINTNVYDVTSGADSLADFGIRGGFIKALGDHASLEIGPAFYATNNQTIGGEYTQDPGHGQPLNFHYGLHTQRVMGEGRVYFQMRKHLSLFAGAGFGIAQLHTTATKFAPPAGATQWPQAPTTKPLTSHQSAYSISGGLGIPLNRHFNLEFGVKKLWVGGVRIAVSEDNGQTYTNIRAGNLNPTTVWTEVSYRF